MISPPQPRKALILSGPCTITWQGQKFESQGPLVITYVKPRESMSRKIDQAFLDAFKWAEQKQRRGILRGILERLAPEIVEELDLPYHETLRRRQSLDMTSRLYARELEKIMAAINQPYGTATSAKEPNERQDQKNTNARHFNRRGRFS